MKTQKDRVKGSSRLGNFGRFVGSGAPREDMEAQQLVSIPCPPISF